MKLYSINFYTECNSFRKKLKKPFENLFLRKFNPYATRKNGVLSSKNLTKNYLLVVMNKIEGLTFLFLSSKYFHS